MNKAGLVDVGYSIKLKKFKFAGHVFRGSNERWVKRTTVWTPYGCKRGKRGKGGDLQQDGRMK